METTLLLSFFGASVLLTIMPGPDNIFVLTESLTRGRKNGITVSAGLSLGVLVHTFAATTGLSILIQQSATVFSAIKYLGALYLFYLAIQAFREGKMEISSRGGTTGHNSEENSSNRSFALIRTGFLMNVLNPKVALFFIAFLPQFVSPGGIGVPYQLAGLGLIFAIQAFLIFSLISWLSGSLAKYLQNDRTWRVTKWVRVTVLSGLALVLLFSKK